MMQAVDVLSRTAGHVGNVVLRARQRAPASVQWATTAGAAALVLHGLRRVLAASRTRSALDSFRHARVLVTGAATTEGHGLGPDVCRELSRSAPRTRLLASARTHGRAPTESDALSFSLTAATRLLARWPPSAAHWAPRQLSRSAATSLPRYARSRRPPDRSDGTDA